MIFNPFRRIRELEKALSESDVALASLKSDKEVLVSYNRLLRGLSAPKLATETDGGLVKLYRDGSVIALFSMAGGLKYHLQSIDGKLEEKFRQSGFATSEGLSAVEVYDACDFLKNCFMQSYLDSVHAY